MNKNKAETKAAKPKAETYEMWKERKLIEELKFRQQASETDKLKATLNERLTEGRRVLNELAINNWLKKKQEKNAANSKSSFQGVPSEMSVKYVRRKTAKPKVDSRMYTQNEVYFHRKESFEKLPSDNKEILQREKSKDEKLYEHEEHNFAKEEELTASNLYSKSHRSNTTKSLGSIDHKKIRIEDDEIALNKQLVKELNAYLKNPNSLETSERQTNNKISFEQWLKKKNAETRERKEKERKLQELKEEQRKEREKLSERAINEWYLKNAFRMVTRDKFLKNQRTKDKWEVYQELLHAHETASESLSESLDT